MEQPLVSILLPVQNAAKHLEKCLESLACQSYTNIEIIAIDDRSTDESFKILKTMRKTDKRFRVYKNKKRYGTATTLNRCVKKAKGKYVAFMGATDRATISRIKKQVLFLSQNPKVAAVGTQCGFVASGNFKYGKSNFPTDFLMIKERLLAGFSLQPETVMVNRLVLPKDILKFKPAAYPFVYTNLLMKISTYSHLANLPQTLYYHRKSAKQYAQGFKQYPSFVRMWLQGVMHHSHTPSLRSLFLPLIKTA